MNAFAEAHLEMALADLEKAIGALDNSDQRKTWAVLLGVRGNLQAIQHLTEMERDLADTERPSGLRIVK